MPLNPKFNEYLKQDFDHLYSLGPDKLREIYKQMVQEGKIKEEVGNVEDRIVKTTLRDTLIRIYRPKTEGTLPVVFWMHGGGFVLGDIEHGDFVCRRITNNTNCAVISIEYSLCPPYKFPEPENECYEIIKWAYENAEELKIDPSRICLAGDSAGASLAAGLCYRFRNEKQFRYAIRSLSTAALTGMTRDTENRELTTETATVSRPMDKPGTKIIILRIRVTRRTRWLRRYL